MSIKLSRILVPFIIVFFLSLGKQINSVAQKPENIVYLPTVSINQSGWIGPFGGSITTIAVDPYRSNIIYAGTFGSGVFKSIDGGHFWFSASRGLTNLEIQSLAIDLTHPSTLYAGTYKNQVFKSTDDGNSWTWSGTGMQDQAIVYSVAVDPGNPSVVYASTRGVSNNGSPPWKGIIYKSTDGGQSWAPSLQEVGGPGLEDWAYSLCINPSQNGQVFAAFHETGPYMLNDAGWHWIPDGIRDRSGRSIVISPKNTSILYLGVWHDDAVYQTLNSGDQWIMANHDLLNVMVYSLALDPYDVNTVYVASYNNGVLKTIDAGSNWLYSGLFTDKLYSIVINPTLTNNLFTGTSGDGLYRSMDFSTNWERSDMGIDNAMVTSIIQVPSYPYPLYSSIYGAGVYQSEYRGQAWSQMNTGLADQFVHDLVVDPLNSKLLYALTDTGGLFKNDLTSGNGWVNTGQGLPVTNYPVQAYSAADPFATLDMQENMPISPTGTSVSQTSMVGLLTMVFAPSDPQEVYIGTVDKGVYRSIDNGTSWIPIGLGGNNIRSMAVDPTDPALVYATTDYYGSLKYSTDGGDSWKDANLQANFYSVATSNFKSGTVYAGTSSGIYNYNHQSDTWTALGLSGQTVTSVAVDINHPGVLFAGTTNGAYYTKDNGVTWIFVDNQLSGQTILSISFDKTDPQVVYFSTKTHGIFLASIGH